VALLALICHLVLEPNTLSTFIQINGINILAIILLGLGPVGGAFYLWDIGMKFGHQSWLASLSFATPVLSTMLLALFGIGYLSINVLLALALIMVGAGICNIKRG
jgi:drug/metabolite transporter (DMT)-like permease